MEVERVHCPKCDREVRIARTPVPRTEGHAPIPDSPEVVCLDFDEACAGAPCPICGVSGLVVGVRLARSELRPEEGWRTVRGRCQGCEEVVELDVLSPDYAYCPRCGTTNRWALLEGEGGRIVVTGVKRAE